MSADASIAVAGAIKETEHGFRAMIWKLLGSNRGPMDDHDSEIEGLIDEHRELMTILARLQRTAGEPGSDLDALLDQLDAELTHHTEREEAGLFHVLHQIDVSPEYMDLFEHDHHHLVELIATVRATGTAWTVSSRSSTPTCSVRKTTCFRRLSSCSVQKIGTPSMPLSVACDESVRRRIP